MSGPDIGWIERAQAAGMSREDIQAYLDAWARHVPSVDPRAEKKAYDRGYAAAARDNRTTSYDPTDPPEPTKRPPDPQENNNIKPSPKGEVKSQPAADPLPLFPTQEDLDWAVSEWNELAEDVALPRVLNLNVKRRRALIARLRELGSRDAWTGALFQIARSPFCRGENNRGWRANFDFVLQPSSMTKLIEGNYEQVQGSR